jgi:hypothetical protein
MLPVIAARLGRAGCVRRQLEESQKDFCSRFSTTGGQHLYVHCLAMHPLATALCGGLGFGAEFC